MHINSFKNRDLINILSFARKFHPFLKLVCKRWYSLFHTNDYLKYTSLAKTKLDWASYCDSRTKMKLFKWLFEFCPNYFDKLCLSWFINDDNDMELISLVMNHKNYFKNYHLYQLITVTLGEERYLEFVVFAYQHMTDFPNETYLRDVIQSANYKVMTDLRLPHIDPITFNEAQWGQIFATSITFRDINNFEEWLGLFHTIKSDDYNFQSLLRTLVYDKLFANWKLNTDKVIHFFQTYPKIKVSSDDFMFTLFDHVHGKINTIFHDPSYDQIQLFDEYLSALFQFTTFESVTTTEKINNLWKIFLTKLNVDCKCNRMMMHVEKLTQKIGIPTHLTLDVIVGCNDPNVFSWMIQHNLIHNLENNASVHKHEITSYEIFIAFQQSLGIVLKPTELNHISDHRITFDLMNNHSHLFGLIDSRFYDLGLTKIFSKDLVFHDGAKVSFETFWTTFFKTQKLFSTKEKSYFLWWHFFRWIDVTHFDELRIKQVLQFLNNYVVFDDEKNLVIIQTLLKWKKYLLIKNLYDSGLLKIDSNTIERNKFGFDDSDLKFFRYLGFN